MLQREHFRLQNTTYKIVFDCKTHQIFKLCEHQKIMDDLSGEESDNYS